MYKFREFAVVVILSLLSACQTTGEVGAGDLSLSKKTERHYIAYLALPRNAPDGTMIRAVFAIDRSGEYSGWAMRGGYNNSLDKAASRALEKCGKGCKVFDIDQKIVWEGFKQAEKYAEISFALKTQEVNLAYYDSDVFQITAKQLDDFKGDYHDYVVKFDSRYAALAISPDGKTARWLNSIKPDKKKLGELVIRMCNAVSGEPNCVVYAYGDEVVTE